jgi:glutamate carboxypeptidase
MTVESVPAKEPGFPENTVATLSGRGKSRILLIGHIDTVFDPGTAQRRPFHMDANRAYGLGADNAGHVPDGWTSLSARSPTGRRLSCGAGR